MRDKEIKQSRFQVKWSEKTKEFKHTWEGVVNVDQFRWLVRSDVQEQLKIAHDNIGAKNVRAVGMLDDELRVIGIDPKLFHLPNNINCRTNFQILDYIVDTLMNMGVNPMFTTTFVPGCMSSGEQTVFSTKGRVNLPINMNDWSMFIQELILHFVDRYGIEKVKEWYFEVWNEPNLTAFFAGDIHDFYKLWKITYSAIKNVDSKLKVGGPSTARGEWIREFLDFCNENDCMPDYIISHIYNKDSEAGALSPFAGNQTDRINYSPNFASDVIREVYELLKAYNFHGEIHWNEWGRSWWLYEPNRETENEAAYIVKTMAEVSQYADKFAYWCLSDVYDQGGYGKEAFHGNYGMLSLQSLKKPSFFAHELLCKLGIEELQVEKEGVSDCLNGIVTRQDKKFSAIFYSYEIKTEDKNKIETLINLPESCRVESLKLYEIDSINNNILGEWRKIGEPCYLKPEQVQELSKHNYLTESKNKVCIIHKDGNRFVSFLWNSPGVVLLCGEM